MASMERHKCKLCHRQFSCGRALGGHMKSHLATLPLPPPKTPQKQQSYGGGGGGDSTESTTSSEHFEEEDDEDEAEEEAKLGVYGLRENPKKSFRLADPEFLDVSGGSVIVLQDRESETESTRKPTRRRSKRTRKMFVAKIDDELELQNKKEKKMVIKPNSTHESLVSSVSSDTNNSPEEDLALCLIMLSRDVWSTKICRKFQCEICRKIFTSSQALGSHKTIHKKIIKNCPENNNNGDEKVHECPFCGKVFGSGQALGGHKRSHFLTSSTTTTTTTTAPAPAPALPPFLASASSSSKLHEGLMIDLNLPAPMEENQEEDEFCFQEGSAVSDANFINPIKHGQ
ncbi:hypothetical protein M9H77_32901 [Catharanthus roseus]|uniref:Uncharacterized protein n=1 Tax=Catharanthus roseus TaxID=4058 RepID=A0ACC0A529_CATRO|nr:hypothetical protein M9H77_32901 [Catharanthus roseus]